MSIYEKGYRTWKDIIVVGGLLWVVAGVLVFFLLRPPWVIPALMVLVGVVMVSLEILRVARLAKR